MPNAPKTPIRTLRVPDEEWTPALELAQARGETLTEVMRKALRQYVKRYGTEKK